MFWYELKQKLKFKLIEVCLLCCINITFYRYKMEMTNTQTICSIHKIQFDLYMNWMSLTLQSLCTRLINVHIYFMYYSICVFLLMNHQVIWYFTQTRIVHSIFDSNIKHIQQGEMICVFFSISFRFVSDL